MDALRHRLARIHDLNTASAVLEWDQETHMPDAGVEARARQVGTLRQMAHELFTADETGALLAGAVPESAVDADLVRVAKEDFERATRVPADLVGEMARITGLAREGWKNARHDDAFDVFRPHLEAIIAINLRKAEALGYPDEPYDALLDEFEPGMRTSEVSGVFESLRTDLVGLTESISQRPALDDRILFRHFPADRQWSLGVRVMTDLGYDFSRGRQDHSEHPFSTTFSVTDSRVTTRIHEHQFTPAFFGSLHEAGHAMYEQGVDAALDGTLLGSGTSLGMHESQSRLWENLVGRSRAFWDRYFPLAQSHFPAALADSSAADFYRAVNRVQPSLIRIEADEVTYNLHIMVRFELERDMLSGAVRARDLPDAWNSRMKEYLGIAPANDSEGCLQDIHWSLGTFGYFPTYALGNLMSAQLWEALARDAGDLDEHIRSGRYGVILDWLREHVHRHGRRKTADQILRDATGSPLTAQPWLAYAQAKFADLYGL